MQTDTIINGIRYEIGRSGYKSPPENYHADEDYPYGRTLRCRRAHWLETASSGAKVGETRHVTCTTNPKHGNRTWNAPKPGGYDDVCILYVKGDHWGDEAGYVGVDSLHMNSEPCEVDAFEARWTGQLGDFERERIKLIRAWHVKMSKVRWSIGGAPVTPKPEPTDEELASVIPDAATMASRVSTLPAAHADGYRAALARAGRMAWVSGLRCLVVAVNHGRGEFNVYPDGPNVRRKILEYPASYRVVGIVDPPAPEPDPDSEPYADTDPAPDGFALDWESIVPELDASIPWERDGRTVKTLQLCTELDYVPQAAIDRDTLHAKARGLDIIAEPVGLFLLRDLGPIPPDVEDEDMPTDRADDDGMRIPDTGANGPDTVRVIPLFRACKILRMPPGGIREWAQRGKIQILTGQPIGYPDSMICEYVGFDSLRTFLEENGLPSFIPELDALAPLALLMRTPEPAPPAPPAPFRAVNRPWLEPIPPAQPALMPPRGKLMAPLDVLMMLDQLE